MYDVGGCLCLLWMVVRERDLVVCFFVFEVIGNGWEWRNWLDVLFIGVCIYVWFFDLFDYFDLSG